MTNDDDFFSRVGTDVSPQQPTQRFCRRMLKLKTAEGKPTGKEVMCGSYFAQPGDESFPCNLCPALVKRCTCSWDMTWCSIGLCEQEEDHTIVPVS